MYVATQILKMYFLDSNKVNNSRTIESIYDNTTKSYSIKPWDIDFNFHMHHKSYLKYLEYSRFHHSANLGILRLVIKNKWFPVIKEYDIKYLKPIKYPNKISVSTKIDKIEEFSTYWHQIVRNSKGQVITEANFNLVTLSKKGKVANQNLIDEFEKQ